MFIPTTRRCLPRVINKARIITEGGSGGGGAGAIRGAGGAFGKRATAREEQYFHEKEAELMKNLKGHLNEQIEFHENQIKQHEEAMKRIRKKMDDMPKKKENN